jgi:hypothetical protein
MSISYPTDLVANSTTFYLVDEGQLRGVARSITSFSNGALATTYPNDARVKVGSLCIATDTNFVYVCTNVANYNLTTGWTQVGSSSLTAGQLIDITSGVVSFDKNGSVTGGQTTVNVSAGNSFRFQGNDATTNTLILKGNDANVGAWASLYLHPEATGSSYITYVHNSLFFRATTTDVAQITQGGNALFYNSVGIGSSSSTITAVLDVRQTGNAKSNLRLVGINSGDNAELDFAPSGAGESFINATSGKLYFQTGGVGTTNFSSTLWTFGLPIIASPTLSSSGTALQISPTFASSSNGILIGGTSANATTRSLSITTTLTGATSNALSITSSVTSVSALGRVVSFSPTLVASANSDVLQTLYLNPTFTLGAFTGVTRYSIFSNNGQTYFNSGDITFTNNPAHFFTFNANTGVGNISTGFVISGTTTSSSASDILFDVRDNTTSRFLVERSSGVTFGATSVNFPNNASLQTSGSASTLIISLGNNRMLNASSSGSANAGTTFKNFSHSHVGTASSVNTGNYTTLLLQDTYTFTGTTGSPVARSLYINPTYTASATSTYRAIEVTRGDIAFNTTSGKVFMGGTSAVSSTTNACLVISKRLDQAQVNFNPLDSAIAGAVLGDIWLDSNTYNLNMQINDAGGSPTEMQFLTYFQNAPPTTTSIASGIVISGQDSSGDALGVPDQWIEFNYKGQELFIPCYLRP